MNTYYERNREHALEVTKIYYYKNRERINLLKRAKRREAGAIPRLRGTQRLNGVPIDPEAKEKILAHYGRVCACCLETNTKLLTVDHIENNGKEHGNGKYRYKGVYLYTELIRLGYPGGIQIRCFNCNIGRRNNKGICPHETA